MDVRFLDGYDAIFDALVADLDDLREGERARLQLYLIEPGPSAARVIGAIAGAVRRGARVEVRADATVASRLARLYEGTRTALPDLHALARSLGRGTAAAALGEGDAHGDAGAVRAAPGGALRVRGTRWPDHAKYAWFERGGGRSSALLASANLGDRFRSWIDHGLRLAGAGAAARIAAAVRGAAPPLDVGGLLGDPVGMGAHAGIQLAANAPRAGRFGLAGAFAALFADPHLVRFRVAVAYIDRVGSALLALALARGAAVDLFLPRRANVYHDLDQRTLADLLAAWPGRLRAWLTPAMLHAKTILAETAAGERLAWIGSPNLRRNSLRMFGELAALTARPEATGPLACALDRLAEAAGPPVAAPLPFRRWRAWIDDALG